MSAYTAQGTTLSWGGSIGRVVSIQVNAASSLREIRPLAATLDEGGRYLSTYEQTTCDQTIDVELIASSSASISTSDVGLKKSLTVSGPGLSYSASAILEKVSFTSKVADILRIQATFRRTA